MIQSIQETQFYNENTQENLGARNLSTNGREGYQRGNHFNDNYNDNNNNNSNSNKNNKMIMNNYQLDMERPMTLNFS